MKEMSVIVNSKEHPIAIIGFDDERDEWRINIYVAHGFRTAQEAWAFWHSNFDPENGSFRGPEGKAASA